MDRIIMHFKFQLVTLLSSHVNMILVLKLIWYMIYDLQYITKVVEQQDAKMGPRGQLYTWPLLYDRRNHIKKGVQITIEGKSHFLNSTVHHLTSIYLLRLRHYLHLLLLSCSLRPRRRVLDSKNRRRQPPSEIYCRVLTCQRSATSVACLSPTVQDSLESTVYVTKTVSDFITLR